MPKPPPATPHPDINGVHRDERRHTDVAAERGESAAELDKAKRKSIGRPPPSDPAPSGGDPDSD